MNTAVPKSDTIERWLLIDAKDRILGRLSTEVANLLRGKDQPQFSPHVPSNTHVVIINADKFKVTGNKLADKRYYRHGGTPGSLRSRTLTDELGRHPTRPLEHAIARMLPDNRLRKVWLSHLHLYANDQHPHGAQNPQPVKLDG